MTRSSFGNARRTLWKKQNAHWSVLLLLCFCITDCNYPRKLSPSDLADAPQSERRTALRDVLSSLTYLPPVGQGESIREVIRAPIYTESLDLAVLLAPNDCRSLGDTCVKRVRLYSWDSSAHTYRLKDSVISRGMYHFASVDLTRDGRDDLILSTFNAATRKQGMIILGADQSHRMTLRFQSDSTAPSIVRSNHRTVGLLEYDSSYAKRLTGIPLTIPRKFYRVFGEVFLEAPADTVWAQMVQHVRDSTHQMYLLSHDEMARQQHPDVSLQHAFVAAVVSEALLDSSWQSAQGQLQRLLGEFTSKLSSANYNTLLRFSLENRAGAFVRQSSRIPAQIVALTGDWDDAIAVGDIERARGLISQATRSLRAADPLYRIASSAVSHNVLIPESNQALLRATELDPRSAQILRLRARTFDLLGQGDSASVLRLRSLQFDSTSSEAFSIRQNLGY